MDKQLIKGKRKARRLAVQALYQWLMSGSDLNEIDAQFRVANDMAKVDLEYFTRLLHGIPVKLSLLEETFSPYLDRPLTSLNPIELTILRLSTFECMYCPETPYKVVLDEAISLAKEFGSQDGHRYVNGVLHEVAKQTRAIEFKN
ncbi:transcription antitermination factor NusB [Legionella adelaidensis]|uniref:transcription antitermination factor NusB n=1 Tax=Legionella adelaidensis TaxID=45056 RepID=UPI0007300C5D|nr:transcription antitermination factor NusB [Legionella adelaidensis]